MDLLATAFVSVSSIDSFGPCKKMGGRPPSYRWYSWAGAWQGQLLQGSQQLMETWAVPGRVRKAWKTSPTLPRDQLQHAMNKLGNSLAAFSLRLLRRMLEHVPALRMIPPQGATPDECIT